METAVPFVIFGIVWLEAMLRKSDGATSTGSSSGTETTEGVNASTASFCEAWDSATTGAAMHGAAAISCTERSAKNTLTNIFTWLWFFIIIHPFNKNQKARIVVSADSFFLLQIMLPNGSHIISVPISKNRNVPAKQGHFSPISPSNETDIFLLDVYIITRFSSPVKAEKALSCRLSLNNSL